ncbi:MAG TPA: hypothetical protein VHG35_18005 [Gemmatimonadales bacterium]|nr:hypothetical protein [Gemmatimonadales bacterium]
MSYTIFTPHRRLHRRSLAIPLLAAALAACDHADVLNPEAVEARDEATAQPVEAPAASVRQAGGVAFGMSAQPLSKFGELYSGAKLTVSPNRVLGELSAIKARGGRVVLMLAGNPRHYKDGRGRFDLGKWKARVNRFRNVRLDRYIEDGTIIGHFLLDEPNDKANWNGTTVSPAVLDEMARHSKRRWPKMATIVRTHPSWFKRAPRHVDAAWAQYLGRRGPVKEYIRENVEDARRKGLALVVGLNVLTGGTPRRTPMTASQVKSWGSALLSSSYPCAFLSWKYDERFLSRPGMRSAMKALRQKAESRPRKSCRI